MNMNFVLELIQQPIVSDGTYGNALLERLRVKLYHDFDHSISLYINDIIDEHHGLEALIEKRAECKKYADKYRRRFDFGGRGWSIKKVTKKLFLDRNVDNFKSRIDFGRYKYKLEPYDSKRVDGSIELNKKLVLVNGRIEIDADNFAKSLHLYLLNALLVRFFDEISFNLSAEKTLNGEDVSIMIRTIKDLEILKLYLITKEDLFAIPVNVTFLPIGEIKYLVSKRLFKYVTQYFYDVKRLSKELDFNSYIDDQLKGFPDGRKLFNNELSDEEIENLYLYALNKNYIDTTKENFKNVITHKYSSPIKWIGNKRACRTFIQVAFSCPNEPRKIANNYFVDLKGEPIELNKPENNDPNYLRYIDDFNNATKITDPNISAIKTKPTKIM